MDEGEGDYYKPSRREKTKDAAYNIIKLFVDITPFLRDKYKNKERKESNEKKKKEL